MKGRAVRRLSPARAVTASVALNAALLFVALIADDRALRAGLEETFVGLTLLFGLIAIVANALVVLVATGRGRRVPPDSDRVRR